jgi:hypothetical protein
MINDKITRLREVESAEIPALHPPSTTRMESQRRHVLNRLMQEKSGRLYCGDDGDLDIPSLEIYAAR